MKKILVLLVTMVFVFCTGCEFDFIKGETKGGTSIFGNLFGAKEEEAPEEMSTPEPISIATPILEPTPVMTPTPEPTPVITPTPEPQKATIANVFEYTKNVIIPEEYKDMGGNYAPHRVYIPEIIDDGEAVKTLNSEMKAIGKDYVDLLENNDEKNFLINISYSYTEQNGIFGIMIDCMCGEMYSEWWSIYYFYYYDSVNNVVLDENAYYQAMGVTKDEIWQRVKSSPEFVMGQDFYQGASLDKAIFNDDIIYAVINTPDAFSENTMLTIAR